MIEGPGHVPFDQIAMNVLREIEECDEAPFYVLEVLLDERERSRHRGARAAPEHGHPLGARPCPGS
jgi:hypothetical protein